MSWGQEWCFLQGPYLLSAPRHLIVLLVSQEQFLPCCPLSGLPWSLTEYLLLGVALFRCQLPSLVRLCQLGRLGRCDDFQE